MHMRKKATLISKKWNFYHHVRRGGHSPISYVAVDSLRMKAFNPNSIHTNIPVVANQAAIVS